MVIINTLLTSMATLYFNNNTEEFIKQNETSTHLTNFYLIDDLEEPALPVATLSGKVSAEVNYFPKCCPPEYVYEVKFRKCVSNNTYSSIYGDLGLNISLIRSNLRDCEVIVDQLLQKFELDNFRKDRSFKYENEIFSFGNYCLDKTLHDEYVARLCYSSEYCIKNRNKRNEWCLKKCCPDGHVLTFCERCTFHHKCIFKPELGLDVTNHSNIMERNDSLALFNDRRDCCGYPGDLEEHQYTIKANGNFMINERGVDQEYQVNDIKYCMETLYNIRENKSGSLIMICSITTENDLKFHIAPVAMIISCIAIFITISVYVFVYKLKKIIQIIIVCYCVALMILYILAIIMYTGSDLGKYCEPMGFVFFFSYISSFSWMNVLCFDIYRTVGSMKTTWTQSRIAILKKMTYYAIYAFFVPSIVTLFLYMGIRNVFDIPTSMLPEFVEQKCVLENFAEGKYGHVLHSVVPVGILIVVNIIFFLLTLRYFLKAKSDLKQISRTAINGNDKNLQISRKKILMILKLTLVMGFTWIFEIIPSIINFRNSPALQILDAIFDIVNGLQGFFIFLIFLAKWETIESLISKLHLDKVLKRNRNGTYQTEPTSSLPLL